MSTRKSGNSGSSRGRSRENSNLLGQQSEMASSAASAVLEAAQSLQSIQQQTIGRVVERQLKAMEQMRNAKTPMALFAVQVDLLTFSYQEMVQFWAQVAGAAAQGVPASAESEAQEAASAAASAMNPMNALNPMSPLNPITPMVQAWQSMLSPLNGAAARGS